MEPFKERQLAQQYKELGNVEIRKKSYADGICHYAQGLFYSPKNLDLLSNRAFAYLQIGCYNSALSDIEEALILNPNHEKCLYRKIKALWGLRKYQEALDFIETELPQEIISKPDFLSMKEKCHKFIKQSKGIYDIKDIMTLSRNNQNNEIAEYTGPVEISEIPTKGRGLLATSNVLPGQLLICSKAFALTFEETAKKLQAIGDTRDYCVGSICQKLSLEPSLRSKIFDLYPGPTDIIPPSSLTKREEVDKKEVGLVDSIVVYNGFSAEMDLSPWADETPSFIGVWILPSYLNHSCIDANAYYYVYGDVMFIRAVRPISKGEEVTISYTPPSNPKRRKYIELREFKCDCQLCLMEDSQGLEVKKEVKKTLKLIQDGLESAEELELQVKRIRKLISLRSEHPRTNLSLLYPCIELVCSELRDRGEWKIFAEIFQKCHLVAENSCYVMSAVYISINLLRCFLALGDEEMIEKWVDKLKLDLVCAYGSVDALKYLDTDIHEVLLKDRGIDLF